MKLSDFETLEKAHEYKTYKDITMNDAINHDATFGVTEIMTEIFNDPNASELLHRMARIYMKIMDGKLPTINVMDDTTQLALETFVNDGRYTQEMRDDIEAYALVKYPYIDTTQADLDAAHLEASMLSEETLSLANSINSEVYTLSIGVDSPKKINIKIMQRFGDSLTDLTPWHEAVSFTNVHYKQQKYRAQIPSCDCTYRELKVVSDYQLNMSIV